MLLFGQEFFNKNGYTHLGKTLNREQLKLMKQECMKTWFDLKKGYDANKNWLKNTLLQNIHHHSDAVRNFYFYGPFIEIMTKIISRNASSNEFANTTSHILTSMLTGRRVQVRHAPGCANGFLPWRLTTE